MKISQIRDMTPDQLRDELVKSKKELLNLRFQQATGQLEATASVRAMRRHIARLFTVRGEKTDA